MIFSRKITSNLDTCRERVERDAFQQRVVNFNGDQIGGGVAAAGVFAGAD